MNYYFNKYLKKNKDVVVEYENPYVCKKCNVNYLNEDGSLICPNCCCIVKHVLINEKNEFDNNVSIQKLYYNKRGHFYQILQRLQGKQNVFIKKEVLELIRERNEDPSKELLKSLKLQKYFIHLYLIKLNLGYPVPFYTSKEEDLLLNLFTQAENAYNSLQISNRNNFLNYHYVLEKLLIKIGNTKYLHFLNKMKDLKKKAVYDKIWNEIEIILGW